MDVKTHRRPPIFDSFPSLVVGESTRLGGISPIPYSSLNLGLHTNDDPTNVLENRKRFFQNLGISSTQVASSYQVHGAKVLVSPKAGRHEGYDALISNEPNLFLAVTIADCTPVLLFDPVQKAVAAIHAGWRGTVAGIVKTTLGLMQQHYNTIPRNCYAYVGTCIDVSTFEVGQEVAIQFEESFKVWNEKTQKYHVDLKMANKAQLLEAGMSDSQIGCSPYSTVLDNQDYFSHRKEGGKTGRMLAVIGLRN